MEEGFFGIFIFFFFAVFGFSAFFIFIFLLIFGFIIFSFIRERRLADSPEFAITEKNSFETLEKLLPEVNLQSLDLENADNIQQIFIHEGTRALRKFRVVTGFCNKQGEPVLLASGMFFIEIYGGFFYSQKEPNNLGYITCKFDSHILKIKIQTGVFNYYLNNKQIAQFFTSNKYIALTDSYIWHDRDYFEYERPEFMTDEQRPRIINFYNDNQAGYQIAQAKVTDSRYSAIGYHEIKRKYSGGNNNHSSPKRIPFDGSGHLKFYTNKILAFYLTDNMFFV